MSSVFTTSGLQTRELGGHISRVTLTLFMRCDMVGYPVESTSCLEPLDLLLVEGMLKMNLIILITVRNYAPNQL